MLGRGLLGSWAQEEPLTRCSAWRLAQRVRGRSAVGRSPTQAELGCFGWLPPAHQPAICWSKSCEAALALAAKKYEKGTWETGGSRELGEGHRVQGAPSAPFTPARYSCDLIQN